MERKSEITVEGDVGGRKRCEFFKHLDIGGRKRCKFDIKTREEPVPGRERCEFVGGR